MYNRSAEPRDYTRIIEALPDKLDIKRHSPGILYLYMQVTDQDKHYDAYLRAVDSTNRKSFLGDFKAHCHVRDVGMLHYIYYETKV